MVKKKKPIFDYYYRNLELVEKHLKIHRPDYINLPRYFCPLTGELYTEEHLADPKDASKDFLTWEHIPPKALGGKAEILTGRFGNSRAGNNLDISLRHFLNKKNFEAGKGEIDIAQYDPFSNRKIWGKLKKDGDEVSFNFEMRNPENFKKYIEEIEKNKEGKLTFSMRKPKDVDVGALRIAHLIAFRTLGYAYLYAGTQAGFNNVLSVMEQIQQPEEDIIDNIPLFFSDFPDSMLGVNIVYAPEEYQCLFIGFDLVNQKQKHRWGVFLPAPDNRGFNPVNAVYKNVTSKAQFNIQTKNINSKLHLDKPDGAFTYWYLWQKLCGWQESL